ncbi:MAG: ATP-binding cassette domain-containing protein [Syntrophales bacterium]|nr:ATP-binding cassette domain-containing protein [Syntrophales bacterium]
MIELKNVTFSYGSEVCILRDVNLTIFEGEYLGIIGPNGCGKSTLAYLLNGLLLPHRGTVCVDGMYTNDQVSVKKIRSLVGMVFQNPDSQIIGLTVEEDVAFGPENLGFPPREIKRRVDEALTTCGIAHLASRMPYTLSGGEKRLVNFAAVLAMQPRYLVCDEPTVYLDPSSKKRILNLIADLHRRGITVIHISHDVSELMEADRILVMDYGGFPCCGSPEDVFDFLCSSPNLRIEPPPLVDLMCRMRSLGFPVRTDINTTEGVLEEITKLLDHFR